MWKFGKCCLESLWRKNLEPRWAGAQSIPWVLMTVCVSFGSQQSLNRVPLAEQGSPLVYLWKKFSPDWKEEHGIGTSMKGRVSFRFFTHSIVFMCKRVQICLRNYEKGISIS